MKKLLIIISAALLVCLLPFTTAAGQEKKTEKKIKVIIDDGSGTKVIIDSVFTGEMSTDSIQLKDGKMIFISHSGDEKVMKHAGSPEHVYVMVTTDGKKGGEQKTMTWTNAEGRGKGEKVVIIKDGKEIGKDEVSTYRYTVHSDKKKADSERTKYVISKDGMLITVEGSDYEKVKAFVDEIELKLDEGKDTNTKSSKKK
jgi:hypothetical protein